MMIFRETNCASPPWEKLRIEDAQPRETMVQELMKPIALGECPWARLDGDVLTIWDDYGHRYIYVIVDYDAATDTFELEWPD